MNMATFDNLDALTRRRYIALAVAREKVILRERIANNGNIPTNEKENVKDRAIATELIARMQVHESGI